MSTLAPLPDARPADSPGELVAGYATQVRRALDDLPDETVEDLTDGLEADLLDALADLDGPTPDAARFTADRLTALFGPPTEYADELRSSAGLAPRGVGVGAGAATAGGVPEARRAPLRTAVATAVHDTRASWTQSAYELRHSARWAPVFDFLASLRPMWWIARAWVLVTVLFWTHRPIAGVPSSGLQWLLLIVATIVSVQWGRGRWRSLGRASWLLPALSVAPVVLVLPVLYAVVSDDADDGYGSGYDEGYTQGQTDTAPSDGVWVDGTPANNLFVYDATGKLVPDAQVYDDRGQPVTVQDASGTADVDASDPGDLPTIQVGDQGTSWQLSPTLGANGSPRWNVFPLRGVPLTDDGSNEPVPGSTAKAPAPPFERAPSVTAPASSSVTDPSAK
jgi:hypothetical protein